MNAMNTALGELLVSEADLASDVIAGSLCGLVRITKEAGMIIPTRDFGQLDRTTKVMVCLLAMRAATTLGVAKCAEASVDEVARVVGFDSKTVGEYLSRLKRSYVAKGAAGYMISPEKVCLVAEEIRKARQDKEDM